MRPEANLCEGNSVSYLERWQCFPKSQRRKVVGARGMEELDARFSRTHVVALPGPPNHHRLVAFARPAVLHHFAGRSKDWVFKPSILAQGFSSPEVLEVQIGFANLTLSFLKVQYLTCNLSI